MSVNNINEEHFFMKSLVIINVLTIAASTFLIPIWAYFVKHIGGDIRTAGYAVFIFSIITGICTILAARIEHSIKHEETIMLITAILLTITYLSYFFVKTPLELFIAQGTLGLLYSAQCPALYSLYHKYMPDNLATYHWGIWNGFYNISIGVTSLISAIIFYYYQINAILIFMAGTSALSLIITVVVMRSIKQHQLTWTHNA